LPDDVRSDYEEAQEVADRSPRGAVALLRLAIQKLCKHLGEKGKRIDDDIGSLVAKGLPAKIQQALDVVRVVGNNAVHPGELYIDDNPEIVTSLFRLVNMIAERMISEPAEIQSLYNSLPAGALGGIAKRDKNT
jgi:hypothetical protein